MEDQLRTATMPKPEELTVVVIAGAASRGAYEAGALARVLPRELDDLSNTVFLGTSSGAINAALWTSFATRGKPLAEVGEQVCDVWRKLRASQVYKLPRPYLRTGLLPLVPPIIPRVLHRLGIGEELTSIFDTRPLDVTARAVLDTEAMHRNVRSGSVKGIGVVATTVSKRITGGRSRIFFDSTLPGPLPRMEEHAIEFVPVPITLNHVLASAAIPALFPARYVSEPPSYKGYYMDGGVRLNAPFSPAVNLNATRLIVISSHPVHYGKAPVEDHQPDLLHVAAQTIHTALSDGLVEDLTRLRNVNGLVRQAPLRRTDDKDFRRIPHLVVAPAPDAYEITALEASTHAPWQTFTRTAMLNALVALAGDGPGASELLSYLRFDTPYLTKLIELGQKHADEAGFTYEGVGR